MIKLVGVGLDFGATKALDGVDLAVAAGDVVAVTGPSGCGKSTLLHVLAGLLRPDRGEVSVGGTDLTSANDQARTRWRLENCGFVFQLGDLVPELTLLDNVALPLDGLRAKNARERARDTLGELGIAELADRFPDQVSGGQAQRAAIARALVHNPPLVLADEPTGSLDQDSGSKVLDLLLRAVSDRGATVVLATHERRLAAAAHREIRMLDGRVVA
ncbi:ATP-binding cassette domain-containing protein [Actinokineospora auranticolor]|uniref:Putative ABC transport system ATP-binding protein n=1 Tax=Actinokineospora auranticolor TaxID=155976 RepID=A0A2S6GDD6_9PSEU|nr:ATP-binding cassette domain-containing protein [Actinokineospora auranticolor]PPK63247.1 putative ABC transport system ATP-binding protein [Actinokineospora auranticolor]